MLPPQRSPKRLPKTFKNRLFASAKTTGAKNRASRLDAVLIFAIAWNRHGVEARSLFLLNRCIWPRRKACFYSSFGRMTAKWHCGGTCAGGRNEVEVAKEVERQIVERHHKNKPCIFLIRHSKPKWCGSRGVCFGRKQESLYLCSWLFDDYSMDIL